MHLSPPVRHARRVTLGVARHALATCAAAPPHAVRSSDVVVECLAAFEQQSYAAYTQSMHSLYTAYAQPIHSLYTAYTQPDHLGTLPSTRQKRRCYG